MVDFSIPRLAPDKAEQQYAAWKKAVGGTSTARLRLIRWRGEGKNEPICRASVGEKIDCLDYASHGITLAIIEADTLVHIHTASCPTPITIASDSIIGREYFDDYPAAPAP